MLTLNVYIYKPLLAAIAGAKDHKALACPMSGNRQSCENFEIFFWKFLGEVRNTFGSHCFSQNFQIWKIEAVFYRWCLESSWQIRLGWLVYFTENVVYVLLILS